MIIACNVKFGALAHMIASLVNENVRVSSFLSLASMRGGDTGLPRSEQEKKKRILNGCVALGMIRGFALWRFIRVHGKVCSKCRRCNELHRSDGAREGSP